jgi:hypothetical protein
MYKAFLAPMIFCLSFHSINAQDCKVGLPALTGTYQGDCKNGKANGQGKASGTDSYEGEFRNGLPDGKGKYVWKAGAWYEGQWSKGMREGKGLMSVRNVNNRDSLIEGFWKKDNYIGQNEKPYVIYSKTVHITGATCRRLNGLSDQLLITLNSETGGDPKGFSPELKEKPFPMEQYKEKPVLTNLQLIRGDFQKRTVDDNFPKKITYLFESVSFPFRAILNIGNDVMEIEFFEPGNWTLDLKMAY